MLYRMLLLIFILIKFKFNSYEKIYCYSVCRFGMCFSG